MFSTANNHWECKGDVTKALHATCPSSLHDVHVILNDQESNDGDGSMNRMIVKEFDPNSKETNLKPKLEITSNGGEKEISIFKINYQEN